MMIKVFDIGSDEEAGFPLVSFLDYEHGTATAPFLKMASARRYISEDVRDFIGQLKQAEQDPDKVHVLISALGSDEYWGANRRGDAWPESALSHKGSDYGYQTYMDHGHTYLHHQNKDPSKAVGKVVYASWNPRMHRVEVVKFIKRSSAPEICARIDRGDMVKTSMGARVKYDVCSLCGHKAKVAADHCRHIKTAAGQTIEGGHRIRMFNPYPTFFDSSVVRVPAAQESGMLRKVAHDESHHLAIELFGVDVEGKEAADKDAYLNKKIDVSIEPVRDLGAEHEPSSEAVKAIQQEAPYGEALLNYEPTLPKKVLDLAAEKPFVRTASTFAGMGMYIRPEEFQYIFMKQAGYGDLAEFLYDNNLVIAGSPPRGDLEPSDRLRSDQVDTKLAEELAPWAPDRSFIGANMLMRVEKLASVPENLIDTYRNKTAAIEDTREAPFSKASLLAALALGYLVYRKMAPADEVVKLVEDTVVKRPLLASSILVGGTMGAKHILDRMSKPTQMSPDYSPRVVKHASWGTLATTVALPIGGAYALSAAAARKEREGYRLNMTERLLRHYPLPASMLGVVGATKLRHLLKKGSYSGGYGSSKHAEGLGKDLALSTLVGFYSPYQLPAAALDFIVLDKIFNRVTKSKATSPEKVVGSTAIPPQSHRGYSYPDYLR